MISMISHNGFVTSDLSCASKNWSERRVELATFRTAVSAKSKVVEATMMVPCVVRSTAHTLPNKQAYKSWKKGCSFVPAAPAQALPIQLMAIRRTSSGLDERLPNASKVFDSRVANRCVLLAFSNISALNALSRSTLCSLSSSTLSTPSSRYFMQKSNCEGRKLVIRIYHKCIDESMIWQCSRTDSLLVSTIACIKTGKMDETRHSDSPGSCIHW